MQIYCSIVNLPYAFTELDRRNIIAIDVNHNVRPDSMLILHAAERVVDDPEFQETIDSVRDRIDEIESLHRTRELTVRGIRLDVLQFTDVTFASNIVQRLGQRR